MNAAARQAEARVLRFGARTPARPPLISSLSARLRGRRLDRELASGTTPWSTPLHSARSLQITSPRARHSLARSLDTLLDRAQTSTWSGALSSVIPPDRQAVLGARTQLRDLAGRLRDGAPVSAAGIAALRELVSDGGGPIYNPLSGVSLRHVLATIRDALDVVT